MPACQPLDHDLRTDVCVIGGGIAGLSTAYLLAGEGCSVAVVEDGAIAGGQTGRTSGHLTTAVDARYCEIVRARGSEAARQTADSTSSSIARIESIVAENGIDCDFTRLDGYLFQPPGRSSEVLDDELQAASDAGLGVQRIERAPIPEFDTGPCLRFPGQAQLHPVKYMAGLTRAVLERGAKVFTGTHASSVRGGHPAQVKTTRGPVVSAGAVVVATNVPINDRLKVLTKQAAYLTYVIAAHAPAGNPVRALYWDTADPYHYVRSMKLDAPGSKHAELLLVGGEDHRSGQAQDALERFARLEAWARERFPGMGAVEYCWSGQVMESIDGAAFIGRNPLDYDNVYIATGDSGQGLTHGTIAGMLLTDLIVGRPNAWSTLYEPSRKSLRSAVRYAQENSKTAVQYGDWLTPGDIKEVERLPQSCGAIVRRGLHKIAVFRDADGVLHRRTAVCPHLGCIVQWNSSAELSDCPCHGSRFDSAGRVVVGPANTDLKEVETG
jgi:glycine/D-amino acid oxidase-like deaminating enzyme/nitrite reductase/ring-hydroxylating ferredoxin subunit